MFPGVGRVQSLRLNTPLACALVGLLFYVALVLARLHAAGGDPSVFVFAGDRFVTNRAAAPAHLRVFEHSYGFDGQYYYAYALDPWPPTRVVHGITIDSPPYRHQRIVYPVAAWLLSLGRPEAVPVALIVVSLLSVAALGWFAGALARDAGTHALWGLLLTLYPGFTYSVALDTPEPLSVAFVLAGLWAVARRRTWLAAALLSLAILTRETAVLVAVAVAGAWLIEAVRPPKGGRRIAWPTALVPLGVFALWQVVLYWREERVFPVLTGRGNIGMPFAGLAKFFEMLFPITGVIGQTMALEFAFIVLFFALAAIGLPLRRVGAELKLGWAIYFVLTLLLGPLVWISEVGFVRVLAEGYALGGTMLLHGRRIPRALVLAGALIVWLWCAHRQLVIPT